MNDAQQKNGDSCCAVYHASDGSYAYCGGLEDDHPACGHGFQREWEAQCGCGKTHEPPFWVLRGMGVKLLDFNF